MTSLVSASDSTKTALHIFVWRSQIWSLKLLSVMLMKHVTARCPSSARLTSRQASPYVRHVRYRSRSSPVETCAVRNKLFKVTVQTVREILVLTLGYVLSVTALCVWNGYLALSSLLNIFLIENIKRASDHLCDEGKVQLYVYDLSHGLAGRLSPLLLNKQVCAKNRVSFVSRRSI